MESDFVEPFGGHFPKCNYKMPPPRPPTLMGGGIKNVYNGRFPKSTEKHRLKVWQIGFGFRWIFGPQVFFGSSPQCGKMCEHLMAGNLSKGILDQKITKIESQGALPSVFSFVRDSKMEIANCNSHGVYPGGSLCPKCHFQDTKLKWYPIRSTSELRALIRGPSDFVGSFILNLVLPEIAGVFFFATWLGALW